MFEPDSTKKKTALSDSATIKLIEPDTTKIKVKLSRADSIKAKFKLDSLHRVDSLSKDSTARVAHFKYVRTDKSFLSFRDKKRSSFYVYPSQGAIQRNITLDSAKSKVTIKELVAGKEIRPSIQLPLDEYIKLRLESIKRDQWEFLGYDYKIVEKKKDFGQLITDITNIDIPLPSSPLLSIFGTPKITIKINGQVDIHGAWRNETTDVITTSALGNTRNEPDFKQTVQLNLSGTIGDKLNITADWNTERQFQYENQLKLRYLGYEDEIIQSVEAGNVSLQTSPLVGGSEALFGVKAQFKMGPFSLTALASQKKSEMKEVSVSGGSKAQTFEIRAWNYSQNHFFVLPIYADPQLNLFNKIYGSKLPYQEDTLVIKQIEVWKSYTGKTNGTLRKANVFINLNRLKEGESYTDSQRDSVKVEPKAGEIELGNFALLTENVDYEVDYAAGIISFKTQIQEQDVVAAAIRIEGPRKIASDDIYIGEFLNKTSGESTQRLVLKLIKPKNLQPSFKEAWKLQLKNIYPIGGRSVKEEGFKLDIKYRQEGREPEDNFEGKRFLEMFGLDSTNAGKTSNQPDGAFDFNTKTFRLKTGELVFPTLQPFGRDFPKGLPADLKYQAIYDDLYTFAQEDKSKDKFIITGEYSAETSSTIQIGFSCVENSVKVLLNNNPLIEGVDYSVDYNLGQVVLRNEAALVPGANLKVTYEQNDLFALASKTLLGFRGIYEVNKETSLGFSYLNLNQETLSDKVKIGEEPLSNSILGLDFRTNLQLPFITNLLDKVISTSAPSNLSINAEYAYINPDPNTKKSTIASDQNKSIAYVDDFEGAKKTIPIGTPYGSWKDISIPTRLSFADGLSDAQLLSYKSKAFWYNINPPNVTVQNIYGNRKQVARDAAQVSVLDFEVHPKSAGTFNINPLLSDGKKNFAGIMKPLSTAANNLKAENIEFIEFWVNIPKAPKDLKLYIDLGQISEEVYQDNRLSTEDKDETDGVDPGEDTGIDGVKDVDEPGYDAITKPDPNHDNYFFQFAGNRTNYSSLNGAEGNIQAADVGRIPDTEDLNRNRSLDKLNSYFRYTVAITDTSFSNPFLKGSSANGEGWYLFQIPLKDATYKEGSPSLSVVETIRFFVEGVEDTVRLRFAEMNLVGNQWKKVLRPKSIPKVDENDEVLTVSVVNVEDNPFYKSPNGVTQEKDRTRPDENILKNEQSLDLVIKNLKDGDYREIVKYLSRPLDVFNYKEMKLFIHGDKINTQEGGVSYYKDEKEYGSEVYIRFGSDSLNFYEYRQPVKADWNEVSLKFAELTTIKQKRDNSQIVNYYTSPVPGVPGHFYGMQGNPTLTRLSYFTIGILNPKDKDSLSVSGSIWVNEMRVLEAEQTPGWAYSATGSLSLADLMRVNFNVTQTDPYYHSLADRFGSREEKRAWGVSMDLDLLKLIPVNLSGSNFRITYSRNESNSSPLYIPSTDIKIEEAQADLRRTLQEKQLRDSTITNEYIESRVDSLMEGAETVNMSESWSLSSVRFKIPTELWYIRDLVNNLSFSFNYNRNVGRTPTLVSSTSWVWNASANYSVTFSRDLYFKPIDIPILGYLFELFTDYSDTKIYFTPQSFTTALTANRKRSYSLNRGKNSSESVQTDFTTTRGAGFTWTLTEGGLLNPSFSYNFDFNSTLAHLLIQNKIERKESEIWSEIFNGVLFGKDYMFKQNFDLKFNPKLPTIFNLDRFISVDGSYSVSYQWQNNFQQAELGKSAGYSNRISARLNIRLKSIFDPLFQEAAPQIQPTMPVRPLGGQTTGGRRSGRDRNVPVVSDVNAPAKIPGTDSTKTVALNDSIKIAADSTGIAAADSLSEYATEEVPSESIFTKSLSALKYGVKYLLFDYDQISINFSQSSSYAGGALNGVGTGFNNFWGFAHDNDKGPSRAFVLGLSNDPGPRVARANIQDLYTHRNDLELKTQRPLWEGASIDITWKIGWGMNKNISMTTDSVGLPTITNIQSTGTLDRSFMSFPPVLIFSFLDSGIKKVSELYDPTAKNPNASLADAFINGFETFSLLSKIPILQQVANYIPRPNWTFSWNGLEKLSFLTFARRVSINHAYSSGYSEGWRITPEGDQEVQTQRIEYGFTPLIGVTMDFNELLGGTFQSSVRYTTKSGFSLGSTTRNITETFSRDISITASYLKSGFDFPLFGISLKNDLEISLSFTSQKTSSTVYDMDKFSEKGKPLDGKTNTVIEPKIRYVMSSRVTLSIFYRRTSIEPEGSSPILPVTTNEAGVDVRISIQ